MSFTVSHRALVEFAAKALEDLTGRARGRFEFVQSPRSATPCTGVFVDGFDGVDVVGNRYVSVRGICGVSREDAAAWIRSSFDDVGLSHVAVYAGGRRTESSGTTAEQPY